MRTIILTGSTGGLGRALVEVLAGEEDSKLICLYRNQKKYEDLLSNKNYIQGYPIKQNDDFADLFENDAIGKSSDIILILNAFSITPIKKIGDYSSVEVENFIYGNITGNVLILNTVVKHCKEHNKSLRIINLDSGAADFPLNGWGNYCAAKAYINSFISVIAAENPEFQIVSFDPGVMNTDMQAEIRAADKTVFNQVDTFIKYKEDNILREPLEVAKQIKERYVISWTAMDIREKMR